MQGKVKTMRYDANMESTEAILDEVAADIVTGRAYDFGYPLNMTSTLMGFYKWLMGSGLCLASFTNAGDPFDEKACDPKRNTLLFERDVIEQLGPLYGFDKDELWGIVTFSGTDGNNQGIYFGAKYLKKKTHKDPVIYVSDAAHYSGIRLADLQNLDIEIIPSDEHGRMIPDALEKALIKGRPALMIYAIGTTFKGSVDDMDSLNAVLADHPDIMVYRHLDAALFGGYLPYTGYRDVVNRKLYPFDSISISGHKFFGIDEPAGFFLTTMDIKNNQNPYGIRYLNCNMPMIHCSRSAITPLKFWWILRNTCREEFIRQTGVMLEMAVWLKERLDDIKWPAWLEPMSNIVYFKGVPEALAEKYNLASDYDERLGGDLSHIVVMQHVTEEQLQRFLEELMTAKENR